MIIGLSFEIIKNRNIPRIFSSLKTWIFTPISKNRGFVGLVQRIVARMRVVDLAKEKLG